MVTGGVTEFVAGVGSKGEGSCIGLSAGDALGWRQESCCRTASDFGEAPVRFRERGPAGASIRRDEYSDDT